MTENEFNLLSQEEQYKVNILEVPEFACLLEYPFVRDDMTWEEYFIEKEYYGEHWNEVRTGEYKPLWKQAAIKKLRSGERVVCHKCGNGILFPLGNYKTTKTFRCDECDFRWNIE